MDSLGDRMKRYEIVTDAQLMRRTPVIVRVDGQAFHTLVQKATKLHFPLEGMQRPFDPVFIRAMQVAAMAVLKRVDGCSLAYIQSDEASFLLTDYATFETDAYFGYRVQKLCSSFASKMTAPFDRYISGYFKLHDHPSFDARVFNIPREDACNYFLWRQQDATKNSISALAQQHFSHKELEGVSTSQRQSWLLEKKDINWNDLPTTWKRGSCIIRDAEVKIDNEIPIFSQDRNYIERFINID